MQAIIMSTQARAHARKPVVCGKCGRRLVDNETVFRTVHKFRSTKTYICRECMESQFVDVNLKRERCRRTREARTLLNT